MPPDRAWPPPVSGSACGTVQGAGAGHVAPRPLRTLMDLPTWVAGRVRFGVVARDPAEVRRSAFRAWSRRALGIVCLDELGHGRALDPVGVLSARPAVLA